MICGDINTFAIESFISIAYERVSFLAMGNFLIHINNICYGRREPDASLLACSYNKVQELLNEDVTNDSVLMSNFVNRYPANTIADVFRISIYGAESYSSSEDYHEIIVSAFKDLYPKCVWAPDGDEAFDDGSYILIFQSCNKIRLIGFRILSNGLSDLSTLSDLTISKDHFRSVLKEWSERFIQERCEMTFDES